MRGTLTMGQALAYVERLGYFTQETKMQGTPYYVIKPDPLAPARLTATTLPWPQAQRPDGSPVWRGVVNGERGATRYHDGGEHEVAEWLVKRVLAFPPTLAETPRGRRVHLRRYPADSRALCGEVLTDGVTKSSRGETRERCAKCAKAEV